MIRFSDVCLTLGDRRVLHNVSFTVKDGETVVLLGRSGSGKTTTLRLLLGLYKPECGAITVGDRDITLLSEQELPAVRLQMAMVFQGAALFDSLTVRENVGYRLWEQGRLPDDEIERVVLESLRFVGLEDTADKMPAELSGGMRKRVGIARALASGARIILYDEPTAGLDPINTALIARLILQLKRKGVTQIVVTHDLETTYQVADRLVMIYKGRVIFDDTVAAMKESYQPAIRQFLHPDRAVEALTTSDRNDDAVAAETSGSSEEGKA